MFIITVDGNEFDSIDVQVGLMGYVPAYDGNGNSRNVSCSKPSLHCRKRPYLFIYLFY